MLCYVAALAGSLIDPARPGPTALTHTYIHPSLLCPDIVTSVSYVKELQEDVTADLECLLIRTIGPS